MSAARAGFGSMFLKIVRAASAIESMNKSDGIDT
jgi:hypothetical protein